MRDTKEGIAADLARLLHPYDYRDVPVAGFPSGDALIAWSATKPREEVITAAIGVLGSDEFPQQLAAMAVLRSLRIPVVGHEENGLFEWSAEMGGTTRRIRPVHQPERLGSDANVGASVKDQLHWAGARILEASERFVGNNPFPVDELEETVQKLSEFTTLTA